GAPNATCARPGCFTPFELCITLLCERTSLRFTDRSTAFLCRPDCLGITVAACNTGCYPFIGLGCYRPDHVWCFITNHACSHGHSHLERPMAGHPHPPDP